MKVKFDLKYRQQIESGEYKVETANGRQVRIICWDAHNPYRESDVVALVSTESGNSENILRYYSNGHLISDSANVGNKDLVVIIPDEDERIRKDIVAAVEMYGDFTQSRKEEIYAYLEKLKEQKSDGRGKATINGEPIPTENQSVDIPLAEWNEDYDEDKLQTRFAFYTYKDEPSVLYLSNVFVEKACRTPGYGTRILKAAEKVAEVVGATTIRLKVKQESLANAWYRKNGYSFMTLEDGYNWLEKNIECMKPNKQELSEEDERMQKEVEKMIVLFT